MLVYAVIHVLVLVGSSMTGFAFYGDESLWGSTLIDAVLLFLLYGGGIGVILIPAASILLRWPHLKAERPTWYRTLLPLWLGLVSTSLVMLPLMYVSTVLDGRWTYLAPQLTLTILLASVAGCALLRRWWFAGGLLIGYVILVRFPFEVPWNSEAVSRRLLTEYMAIVVVVFLIVSGWAIATGSDAHRRPRPEPQE
jgi:hypothetical protein